MAFFDQRKIFECSHCGNITPHELLFEHNESMLFDETEGDQFHDTFHWGNYKCGTCGGLNLLGGFEAFDEFDDLGRLKLYPKGSNILPPQYMVSPKEPIPQKVVASYTEVWPLRHRSPTAFVGQIRRLLEYICMDQNATGGSLFAKLQDLVSKGIFPGYFSEITDLLRVVGNIGSHASTEQVDRWDAELIDEFFRSVVEYVYVAPARIARMRQRMKRQNES